MAIFGDVARPAGDSEREAASRIQERLALLVRAGEMFHRSLDVDDTLANVARMAIESFSDLCLFDLIDETSDRLYVSSGAHRDPALETILELTGSSILYDTDLGVHPAVRVTQTGDSFFVPVFDEAAIELHAASAKHAAFMRTMGYRSKIVVPVIAQGKIFGALTFVRSLSDEAFDNEDVSAAQELGRRAGLAVANAKQYHREQHVAATLQRAFLLQSFPGHERLAFSALYRPAKGDAELGGDWYDAFTVSDGSVVITIGDVAGKGIEAARLMVQLRQSIRIAAIVSTDPNEILRLANAALFLDGTESFATAFIGVIAPDGKSLRYASAGHPPAILRADDGTIRKLDCASLPLGVEQHCTFAVETIATDMDAQLVIYTDGTTESTRDALAGETLLCEVIASKATIYAANTARYVERTVVRDRSQDDIAIMTVRFGRTKMLWGFDVADTAAAYALKDDVIAKLRAVSSMTEQEHDDCQLILSELVGNAVRYAPGALSISISQADGTLRLHVIDEGPGFDHAPALPEDVWSESGRGLFLIKALSKDLTIQRLPGRGTYTEVILQLSPLGA
jgi:serine phosphatase RsbU (regulator of sigma subunit)/anti-sigma regulatory factor (Ser/Thr protein kinase)